MKILSFVSLSVVLVAAFVSQAQAAPSARSFEALAAPMASDAYAPTPYDHCHGRSSGTADAKCGQTLTGGPAGSLF